jgi:hypothetical protein
MKFGFKLRSNILNSCLMRQKVSQQRVKREVDLCTVNMVVMP